MKEKMHKSGFLAGGLALTVLLAACGGGGDSTPAPEASTLTVQGTAIKGPLAKAKISLYKTTADGKQGDLLQEVTSDENGKYSVTVTGYSGVVLVVASVVPGQTTMYDEATGQAITPAAGFKLRASFPATSGQTYSVQVNPFTDLATATALAKTGGLNAANVEQANKDLAEALTFNPLTTTAEFDASKTPKNAAAAALAALSQMAKAGDLGCAGDQAAKVACVTQTLAAKGLTNATVKAALQSNLDAVVDKAGLPVVKVSDPSGTPVTAATTLEQAKAFIGTLRSNAKALNAADLSLQTELQKVADDLHSRTAPVAQGNLATVDVARLGVQFWSEVVQGSAPFVANRSFLGAGCGLYSDANYQVSATSKSDAKYVACSVAAHNQYATDANGIYKSCKALGELCHTTWSIRVRLHPDAVDAGKFTVYTQTREAKFTAKTLDGYGYVTSYNEARTHYGAPFPGNAATLVAQRDGSGQVTGVNVAGEQSPAFQVDGGSSYYDGGLGYWVYKPGVTRVLGDKQNVTLAAALSKVGDLDRLSVSGAIELIKSGALESRIEVADGSYLQAKPDVTGGYGAPDSSHELLLKLRTGSAISTVTGDLKLSQFKLDAGKANYLPTLLSFSGSVQRNGAAFFEGTLTGKLLNHAAFNSSQPLSSTNYRSTGVDFDGKVSIPNRPVLSVYLSVVEKETGSSATNTAVLSGQYKQGSITINVSGSDSAAASVIALESSEGVKLVLDKSKATYPLTKAGQLVGEFTPANGRLTYTDNSYEQF